MVIAVPIIVGLLTSRARVVYHIDSTQGSFIASDYPSCFCSEESQDPFGESYGNSDFMRFPLSKSDILVMYSPFYRKKM